MDTHIDLAVLFFTVQREARPRSRGEVFGFVCIEEAFASSGRHDIPITLAPEPSEAIFGGNAPIHDNDGFGWGLAPLQHGFQCLRLAHITRKDTASANKAALVKEHPQRE